jgi:hypothetical protein
MKRIFIILKVTNVRNYLLKNKNRTCFFFFLAFRRLRNATRSFINRLRHRMTGYEQVGGDDDSGASEDLGGGGGASQDLGGERQSLSNPNFSDPDDDIMSEVEKLLNQAGNQQPSAPSLPY